MRKLPFKQTIASCSLALLAACGGGDTKVADGVIGGTGITASGPIAGFGSVIVNGIEFRTSPQTQVSINHATTQPQAELALGWVVTVQGMLNADGITGIASRIDFDSNIRGPIENLDLGAGTFSVLGQRVRVNKDTVFQGTMSLTTLSANDMVEVSGFVDAEGGIFATYIEQQGPFVPGASELLLRGAVANLAQHTFSIGGLSVDYSTVPPQDFLSETLSNAMAVEVLSDRLPQNGVLTATHVRKVDPRLGAAEGGQIVVQGLISNFDAQNNFAVSGFPIEIGRAHV